MPSNIELLTFNGREGHIHPLALYPVTENPAFDVNNIKLLYYIKEVFQFLFFLFISLLF